jgi:CBS domain-containing membrane protein
MRIAEILTPNPICIEPEASLERAIGAMERHDCRHLLVESQGRLVGVLSDRDLLAATGWVVERSDARVVSDVMTRNPKTADPRTEVVAAATQLELDSIGCLPVLDDGRIVGIVTETDFAAAWLRAQEGGALDATSDPRVEAVMSKNPIVVAPCDSVLEARLIARSHRIRHLPVVENGKLLGVISDRDMKRAEGRHHLREAVLADALKKRTQVIEPTQRLSLAVTMMLDRKIGCLPVVDDGRLVGIVTMTDVLDHCVNTLWRPERLPAPRDA